MWLVSTVLLWGIVLLLAFLLIGMLQAQGRLAWRLEQLEAITPRRVGRSGLRPGTRAPDFLCPTTHGEEKRLNDWHGRKVLLVFMQVGCGPCESIIPALNTLQENTDLRVIVVNNGQTDKVREWVERVDALFPVLVQENHEVSRQFQVFATPFAFLIDEQRVVLAKGFVTKRRHLDYLLTSDQPTFRTTWPRADRQGVPLGSAKRDRTLALG